MAQKFDALTPSHQAFIEQQQLFFVATALKMGHVNLSPKGMDSLRLLSPNSLAWLNVTGSGNETAAHVQTNPRMTLMFCAFEDDPTILRVYGDAQVIHRLDPLWDSLSSKFPELPGARQIFKVDISLVQTSYGMSVPLLSYDGERKQLNTWAEKKGAAGIERYWAQRNQHSLDKLPTNILELSLRNEAQ